MEIGYVVNELWRLRRWIALGVLVAAFAAVAVLYEIPSFEDKSLELGAASAEILVERESGPLGRLNTDPATASALVNQTALYARLLGSRPVKELIGQDAGIPGEVIATTVRQVDATGREVAAEERANELLFEDNSYRILASPLPEVPIIAISTQAPTGDEAIRLADSAVRGLRGYVIETAARENVARQVRFRPLGRAVGGTLTQNANLQVAGLAAVAAFVMWCVLVLLSARLRAGWREAQAAERGESEALRDATPQPGRGDVAA